MEKFKEIFYNTKSGYVSKNNFIKAVKLLELNVKEAEKWYDKQPVNQIYKKQNQKKKYRRIESLEPGNLQIDLMIMSKFPSNKNKGYNYILNIMDVYSRYIKSYALKKKKPDEIFPHIKSYIKEFRVLYPDNNISVTVDDGKEFLGKVKSYFYQENIKIYIATPNDNSKLRNMIVERYHRTFWEKLRKILTHEDSLKWVDYYEDITQNYNTSIHSRTKMTPESIFIDKKPRFTNTIVSKNSKTSDIIVGDTVRVLKNKKLFSKKSFTPNWSIRTYIIEKIQGKRYFVNNKKQSYLSRELQKVEPKEIKEEPKEELKEEPKEEPKEEIKEEPKEEPKKTFNEQMKEHKKVTKKIRTMKRENIGDVDEEGKIIINKRLVPTREKRERKKPQRFGY